MKRTSILFAGLMASAGLVIAGAASAQELTGTLKKIKDSGSISVGHRDASIPFSYLDDKQQPIGYSMDLCMKIVDAVKANLKMPNLKIVLTPVTSATRIPLLANGTVDMECGSTTNNLDRQKQISYVVTTFVTANRVMAKKSSKVAKLDDLKGKALVSTSGTTNLKQVTELNASRNLGMNIMAAKDHAEAFLMVETDRVTAFAMDDILLYGLVASAKTPGDFMVSNEALS
ncbi:MAG: amino acid ABC transporter substrate-binding protein, partial [Proteobacteria bacterium]|nr:amino acid ABC transporter substrate-binding protein [Pseudomonadota bacterium]